MWKNSEAVSKATPYREVVGCLLKLATTTRPYIAFSVSKAAKGLENQTQKNWQAVKRFLRHIKGTTGQSTIRKIVI